MLSVFAVWAAVITLVAAIAYGVAAHLSPRDDWEFIRSGPGWILGVVGAALQTIAWDKAQTAHLVGHPSCNPLPCHTVFGPPPPPFGRFLEDAGVGIVRGAIISAVGLGIGIIIAAGIKRSRQA